MPNHSTCQNEAQHLLHNHLLHGEALERKRERCPDIPNPPASRTCNQCGTVTGFNRTNPGLTSQVWCEPCYERVMSAETQHRLFYGDKHKGRGKGRGYMRHVLHNQRLHEDAMARRGKR